VAPADVVYMRAAATTVGGHSGKLSHMKTPLTVLFTLVILGFALRVSAGDLESKPMTQGELAKRVAFLSGLADGIPAPVTGEAAASALANQGWSPLSGWHVGTLATKEDFYVVMAKYLGLKPKDPTNPQSYYDALTAAGFTFGGSKDSPTGLVSQDRTISRLVLEVNGDAEFRETAEGEWAALSKLQLVKEGMSFRTGATGFIDVVYAKGAAQRIYENSEVVVEKLKDEVIEGASMHTIVVYISKGSAVSLVDPMNKASQFVMRDPFGTFEVDKAAGCQFTSQVTDDQSVTLNKWDRQWLRGYTELVEVQPRQCVYVVTVGGATYTCPGNVRHVGSGESILLSWHPGADRIDARLGVASTFPSLTKLAQPSVTSVGTGDRFLTSGEVTALVGGLGGGSVNPGDQPVTPVQ